MAGWPHRGPWRRRARSLYDAEGRLREVRALALLLSALVWLIACDRGSHTAAPVTPADSSATVRRPVSLPDLSSASESVQALIRERYASLKSKIDSAETTSGDLAAAYGDLGKL